MNIQIFGTKKCNNTKKAQRFFKERKINFQFIDLREKEISRGEFNSVKNSLGGYKNLIDYNSKDKDTLALLEYLTEDQVEEKLWENQQVLITPIVRSKNKATVGYAIKEWEEWIKNRD